MKHVALMSMVSIFLLFGCSDDTDIDASSNPDSSPSSTSGDPVIDSLFGSPVTQAQFVAANKIDNLSASRRAAAFDAFEERYQLAEYLLDHEISKDKNAQIRIATVVSKEVLGEYFDSFLDAGVTEAYVESYFDENKDQFIDRELNVTLLTLENLAGPEAVSNLSKLNAEQLDALTKDPERQTVERVEEKRLRERITRPDIWRKIVLLHPGAWSEPIVEARTIYYYRLNSVEETPRRFDDVKAELRYRLREEARSAEYQRLLEMMGVE